MKITQKKLINFLEHKIINDFNIDKNEFDIHSDLIGSNAIIKSSELLEVFLSTENFLNQFSKKFDWPRMMSLSKNPHPASNIISLVEYIFNN